MSRHRAIHASKPGGKSPAFSPALTVASGVGSSTIFSGSSARVVAPQRLPEAAPVSISNVTRPIAQTSVAAEICWAMVRCFCSAIVRQAGPSCSGAEYAGVPTWVDDCETVSESLAIPKSSTFSTNASFLSLERNRFCGFRSR